MIRLIPVLLLGLLRRLLPRQDEARRVMARQS